VGFDNLSEIYPRKDITVGRDQRSLVKVLLYVLCAPAVPKGCSYST
jgi:hypothetical protein